MSTRIEMAVPCGFCCTWYADEHTFECGRHRDNERLRGMFRLIGKTNRAALLTFDEQECIGLHECLEPKEIEAMTTANLYWTIQIRLDRG